jgi:hypothetical protein
MPIVRIFLSADYELVQTIRLLHALAETSFRVCIPAQVARRVESLEGVFGVRFHRGLEGAQALRDVAVDHARPVTRIGSLQRHLLFPHAIIGRLRAGWPVHRPVAWTFRGLMTPNRAAVLQRWLQTMQLEHQVKFPNDRTAVWRFLRRLAPSSTLLRSFDSHLGRIEFGSNRRGRVFPTKSWDPGYYRSLWRARYALCPSGNHIWTYRFFEAVLCGAIPVVEELCPAYEGFVLGLTGDREVPDWTPQVAERNFQLCRERITAPRLELEQAIASQLAAPPAPGERPA